jgi:adenylyltransferase/sulfurtransferase
MPDLERYVRQMRFAPFGEAGQRDVVARRVLICGCGALGSVQANTLARAGVGHLRIVDRDFLELNNLQRQVLFDEQDVADGLPKAIAAARRLRRINSQVAIEPVVRDVDHDNIEELLSGVDVILDGTDNFETRFLLNDAAHRFQIPWVYGGCIGAEGQQMTIVPGRTACLRCLIRDTPPPGTTPTCDTAGILGPIVNVIASLQAVEALKLLGGKVDAISTTLNVCDLWDNRIRQIDLESLRKLGCPTCRGADYPWLRGERGSHSAVLCGRNAVQLVFPRRGRISLPALAEKLSSVGRVTKNPFLVRLTTDDVTITVFDDGRAIVGGTDSISEARTLYARYVGS